jgi:hypothetical protein
MLIRLCKAPKEPDGDGSGSFLNGAGLKMGSVCVMYWIWTWLPCILRIWDELRPTPYDSLLEEFILGPTSTRPGEGETPPNLVSKANSICNVEKSTGSRRECKRRQERAAWGCISTQALAGSNTSRSCVGWLLRWTMKGC